MNKNRWVFPGNVAQVITKISQSENMDQISWYETVLVSYIMAPIGFVQSVLNFYVRRSLDQSIAVAAISTLLIAVFSIVIQIVALRHMSHRLQIHAIGLLGSGIILLSIVPGYFIFVNSSWQILLIMLLITVMRMDKVMFLYVSITALCINGVALSERSNGLHGLHLLNYFTQCLFLIVALIVGLIENRIYRNLINNDLVRIERLKRKNEAMRLANQQIQIKEEKLLHLSNYDPLTNLPNRRLFMRTLKRFCQTSGDAFAVVFIDLDNFKRINDTMGHHIGDLYLTEVSRRMKEHIREGDILGRLGGDEFALIAWHYHGQESLIDCVRELQDSFKEVFSFGKYETRATSSFGIACFPSDATNAIDLLKAADTALYEIKRSIKNNMIFFNQTMKEKLLLDVHMEKALRSALQNGELFLTFQPLFRVEQTQLSGFEALLRWRTAEGRVIEPLQFIPIAEKTGMIEEIGRWVLRQACRKINEVNARYKTRLSIAVNVSTVQMKNPLFADQVNDIIRSEKTDASLIDLEITESVFIGDMDQAIKAINKLIAQGVHVVLDDFGTGYSSLNYLKQLPVDTLKIDKSFTDGLLTGQRDKRIVAALIELMHSMTIRVVTEGVEDASQLAFLTESTCDEVQGFLLSKPLNELELNRFLQEHLA
ncbi:MAG: EAL domain-containing protein [Sporolactobacillus sp.]